MDPCGKTNWGAVLYSPSGTVNKDPWVKSRDLPKVRGLANKPSRWCNGPHPGQTQVATLPCTYKILNTTQIFLCAGGPQEQAGWAGGMVLYGSSEAFSNNCSGSLSGEQASTRNYENPTNFTPDHLLISSEVRLDLFCPAQDGWRIQYICLELRSPLVQGAPTPSDLSPNLHPSPRSKS